MKDRIKRFMDSRGITAAELADSMGVQRSNVSHILNGRNYPGAVFLEKLLITYPELDARWLLTGKGEMVSESSSPPSPPAPLMKDILHQGAGKPPHKAEIPDQQNARRIQRIIMFYNDNTFTAYSPAD